MMMNQRIKELVEQAGFYVADDGIYMPSTGEDITKFQEKFVELLVRECARVDSEENNPEHIDGETYNYTILYHFGIE